MSRPPLTHRHTEGGTSISAVVARRASVNTNAEAPSEVVTTTARRTDIRVGGTGDRPTHDDRQEGAGRRGPGRQGSRDEGPEEGEGHVRPSSRGSRGRPSEPVHFAGVGARGVDLHEGVLRRDAVLLAQLVLAVEVDLDEGEARGDAVARDGLLRRPAGGAPGRVEEVDDLGARPRVDLVRVLRLGEVGARGGRGLGRGGRGLAGACEGWGQRVGVADPAGDVAATGGAPVSVAEPHPASRRARATVTAVVTGRAWGRGRIGCSSGRRGLSPAHDGPEVQRFDNNVTPR